jgi:DNA-binding protein HU-beta
MTKQELIERVCRTKGLPPDITKKTVIFIIETVFDELIDYFVKSKVTKSLIPKFTYPGFGTFTKRKRPERVGRNPQTGESIVIPANHTVSFSPGQDFRADLNNHRR